MKHVKVVDPYNLKEMEKTVKEFLENDTVSVIVAKRRCYLLEYREKRKKGITTFEIVGELTDEEKKFLKEYACIAFYEDDKGNIQIDETMCWGCASCSQLIEAGKIKPRKK